MTNDEDKNRLLIRRKARGERERGETADINCSGDSPPSEGCKKALLWLTGATITIAAIAIALTLTSAPNLSSWTCEQIFGPRPRFGYVDVMPRGWAIETAVEAPGTRRATVLDREGHRVCIFDGHKVYAVVEQEQGPRP